jgi:hypothetical protein
MDAADCTFVNKQEVLVAVQYIGSSMDEDDSSFCNKQQVLVAANRPDSSSTDGGT